VSGAHGHGAGKRGEDLAAQHLTDHGYAVVARNWRPASGYGEIDIVATHGDATVFVEVRTRHGSRFGQPEETIDRKKRAKLLETAQRYLDQHQLHEAAWRIDVIAVDLGLDDDVRRLTHIEAAVSAE
jgi:putative endonuclease